MAYHGVNPEFPKFPNQFRGVKSYRRQPSLFWRIKRGGINVALGAFCLFVALVVLWPLIWGGTILYVVVHFLRKVW